MRGLVVLALVACKGGDSGGPVHPTSDDTAGPSDDTGDTQSADDTGDTEPGDDTGDTDPGDDTGATDPSGPLDGYGDISGDCWVLDDTEWKSASPFLFQNAIDLDGEPDPALLTDDGQEVYTDGNLGGSSIWSEIFACELLVRCEGAALVKTEREIDYEDDGGKKTDLLVTVDGRAVGVSVTRAYHYPPENPYTEDEAAELLTEKLGDILLSAENAAAGDAWERSVLHVVAYDEQYAAAVEAAWGALDGAVRDRTIVVVTTSDGDDDFLY